MFPRKVIDLRTEDVPTTISANLTFHVYTWNQLQKLINDLPEGITQKQKGNIIPFAQVQLETGNIPVALKIKQCAHDQCNRLFLSAGPIHRICHHYHKHSIDRLY